MLKSAWTNPHTKLTSPGKSPLLNTGGEIRLSTFLLRDQEILHFIAWKTTISSLWTFNCHPFGWCFMVCIHTENGFGSGSLFFCKQLQSAWHAFGLWIKVEDKVHPSMKGALKKDHQSSGGSQAVEAHHWHEQTPWNSIQSWCFSSAPGLASTSMRD